MHPKQQITVHPYLPNTVHFAVHPYLPKTVHCYLPTTLILLQLQVQNQKYLPATIALYQIMNFQISFRKI